MHTPVLTRVNVLGRLSRYLITGATVVLAVMLAWALWWHYMRSPWTRDGRVRAEVVDIAAEISGKVIDLKVADNEAVKKGDILFEIDPVDYRLALTLAEANVESRNYDNEVAREKAERRQILGARAVISTEEMTSYKGTAQAAEAEYEAAVAARDQAKVNLERTVIRSPVNGYVTNLTLRVGDYATPGQTRMTLVDSDSFWIAGYFEETKLPRIRVGDYAHVKLMGWRPEVTGHVESISRGIADENNAPNYEGLADVNPVFTWVRLAQRLPVRIKIDRVPDNVTIAAGQTCTIVIDPTKSLQSLGLVSTPSALRRDAPAERPSNGYATY